MSRRSTARRASAKKRYTVDAFEGIEELQDAISEHSPVRRHSRDSDSADEFKIEVEAANAAEDEEEDEEEDEDVEAEVHSNAASDAGEKELDDAMSIAGDDDDDLDLDDEDEDARVAGPGGRANPKKARVALTGPDGAVYNRGLPDTITRKSGKADKRLFLFGSSIKEYGAVEKAFLKWNGQDTLPTYRKPLDIAARSFDYSYWQGDAAREREEEESWKWYFEHGGKQVFSKRQTTVKLSAEEGRARVATSEVPERTFLMGPFNDPKLFRLRVGESLSLNDAWQQPQAAGFKPVPKKATRSGFVLNLGTKIKCTEWAPNQSETSQYLAISTLHPKELPKNIAPAYTPQPSYPAEIQIWKFAATANGSLDSDSAPVLKHVFCTQWGDVKTLRWCPAPYEQSSTIAARSIGLLAGIWGDGGLRVIDVMGQPEPLTTNYLQLEKAAFESHPPDTLFTCLTWISANRLAAGCANGCVAIFDLSKHSNSGSPRPVSYTSIASSYVLSIASCYPSHPNLLITTAADGYPRLTDLNQPHPATATGTVLAPRSRATQNFAVSTTATAGTPHHAGPQSPPTPAQSPSQSTHASMQHYADTTAYRSEMELVKAENDSLRQRVRALEQALRTRRRDSSTSLADSRAPDVPTTMRATREREVGGTSPSATSPNTTTAAAAGIAAWAAGNGGVRGVAGPRERSESQSTTASSRRGVVGGGVFVGEDEVRFGESAGNVGIGR